MRVYFGIIVTACLASLVLSAVRRAHVASEADVEQVATAVRQAYRDGDLIVVVPYHQGTPRRLLGDLPLIEARHLEPELLRLHPRLLLIAFDAIGKRDDLVKGMEALGAVTELAKAGTVSARRIDIAAPTRVTFDLRRDLQRVQVTAYGVPCSTWNDSRWSCPSGGDWNWVGRLTTSVGDGPRACVWMHPLDRGRPLEVTLPATVASTLVLAHGFTNTAVPRGPVHLEVERGERKVHAVDVSAKEGFGVERVVLGDTSDMPVTIRVSSADNAGAHFCIDAWLAE